MRHWDNETVWDITCAHFRAAMSHESHAGLDVRRGRDARSRVLVLWIWAPAPPDLLLCGVVEESQPPTIHRRMLQRIWRQRVTRPWEMEVPDTWN